MTDAIDAFPLQWPAHVQRTSPENRAWGGFQVMPDKATRDLARMRALIRRAHDAMTRRDPDGISTEAWDQLVADMAKELGVGNA